MWRLRPWREVKRLRLACELLRLSAVAVRGAYAVDALNDALAGTATKGD